VLRKGGFSGIIIGMAQYILFLASFCSLFLIYQPGGAFDGLLDWIFPRDSETQKVCFPLSSACPVTGLRPDHHHFHWIPKPARQGGSDWEWTRRWEWGANGMETGEGKVVGV
jgi:hypothetical protein